MRGSQGVGAGVDRERDIGRRGEIVIEIEIGDLMSGKEIETGKEIGTGIEEGMVSNRITDRNRLIR